MPNHTFLFLYSSCPSTTSRPSCHLVLAPAVKGIKRQHLVELRSMHSPPVPVKLALESICFLLGESTLDWRSIRGFVIRDNFIPVILNFDVYSLP